MLKILKKGLLLKYGKSVKAASVVVNYDDLLKQECHHVAEFCKSCDHRTSHSRGYHSSYEDSGGGYRQTGPECDWKKRSFQFDMWSKTHGCWHFLEAVGWGTAVVTGLQITDLCHRSFHQFDGEDRNKCWVKSLVNNATAIGWAELGKLFNGYSQYTFARVLGTGLLTSKSILPSSDGMSKQVAVDQSGSDCAIGSSPYLKPFSTSQSDVANVLQKPITQLSSVTSKFSSQSDVTETQVTTDGELSWNMLTEQCMAAIQCNAEALTYAQQGDISAAVRLWQKSCSSAVYSPSSLFNLALCYEHGLGVTQDIEKASDLYGKASELGHAKSAFNLAMLLLNDVASSANNFEKAVTLLHKAADLNLKEAQRELGVLYMEPALQDMAKAVALFELAASQEDARATYFLGICYEKGWGIDRNEVKAASLYKTAGSLGHIDALYNLGVFFERGIGGLPVDLYEAIRYYQAAACVGHQLAADRLDLLKSQQPHQTVISAEAVKGKPQVDVKSAKMSMDHAAFSPISRTMRFSTSSDGDWSEYSSISDENLSMSGSSTSNSMWHLSPAKGLPNVFVLHSSKPARDTVSSYDMASSPDEGNQSLGDLENHSFEGASSRCSPTASGAECDVRLLSNGTFGEIFLPHLSSALG